MKSKQVMFLTGAGISVASGIQTFRGANGFWDKEHLKEEVFENVKTPEDILTLRSFEEDGLSTWKWLIDFYWVKEKARPNKGHEALHKIIQEILGANKKAMLVTQNIDNFHSETLFLKQQGKKPVLAYPIH